MRSCVQGLSRYNEKKKKKKVPSWTFLRKCLRHFFHSKLIKQVNTPTWTASSPSYTFNKNRAFLTQIQMSISLLFFSNNKKNKCTHYHMQFGILSNSFGCVIYVQSIRKWSEYQSIVIRINVFYFFVFITVLSHKHTFFAIVLASKRRRMCDIPSSQFDVKSFFNRHTHIYKKAIYVITTRRVL